MERLGSWSLRLGQTVPSEPPGVGGRWVWESGVHSDGSKNKGAAPPRRLLVDAPHLSPGLSSAEMPGPAKPAVPVGHPRDPLPTFTPFPKMAPGRPGPSSRERMVSRWMEGRLKCRRTGRPNGCFISPPPSRPACPACPAYACSFHHPALGSRHCPYSLLRSALPPRPSVPTNPAPPNIHPALPAVSVPFIHSAIPTEGLSCARCCSRHWGYSGNKT